MQFEKNNMSSFVIACLKFCIMYILLRVVDLARSLGIGGYAIVCFLSVQISTLLPYKLLLLLLFF